MLKLCNINVLNTLKIQWTNHIMLFYIKIVIHKLAFLMPLE